LYSVTGLTKLDSAGIDTLLTNLDKNDYFYDKHVPNVVSWVQEVYWLQNEEHIRDKGCLEWRIRETTTYDYVKEKTDIEWYYDLKWINANGERDMGSIPAKDIGSIQATQMVEDAIRQQLSRFHYAKNRLDELQGLYFIITDGDRQARNVSLDADAEFFLSQPVYFVGKPGNIYERSRTRDTQQPYSNSYYYDESLSGDNLSIYIAFSSDAVDRQNYAWRVSQRQLETQLAFILAPGIIMLALFIILVAGAGRKYGGEPGEIYFMPIDKPWLDLSLCVLAVYEVLLCYVIYEAMSVSWRYENIPWIIALCAIQSVFFALPLLGWALSFAKRCKAGKWWRHTLIYTLVFVVFNKLRRLVKSLWAGASLTIRAVLVGCALFAGIAVCSNMYPEGFALIIGFALALLAVFGMLRYARKLYIVQQGAKVASAGRYDTPISVTGGELGSIADSINSISDGINAAVTERLKSERLKTELITNISHDIRTPITSLITYSDLLKSEGLDSERAPEYLEILIQKSARLKTLTDDLFEASKAASGNIEVHMENLDLADLVKQVLGELDERVRGSGLDFRLNLPEHAQVRADGKLLWRVMENLLSNVFKYSLKGSRVYIDIAEQDDWYRLDIKNISERPLNVDPSELTERFKRGDDARAGDGSGLGLSIAQSFMQSQGGRFALSIDGDLFKASLYLPG